MSSSFDIIQLEVEEGALIAADSRTRNQFVGSMHAHNELAVLNRVLLFSMNDTGSGELHDSAHSVQTWCLLQLLAGKLVETWHMLVERFLSAVPEDPILSRLSADHQASLAWLKDYFGVTTRKTNALRTLRDKTAFHFDKLNLGEATKNLGPQENVIYLAQHPANGLYYLGSSLVFRTVFALIADSALDTNDLAHEDRTRKGFEISSEEAQLANWHMHLVLYGLINELLVRVIGAPPEKGKLVRIRVQDAPEPERVGLPTFIDIGQP